MSVRTTCQSAAATATWDPAGMASKDALERILIGVHVSQKTVNVMWVPRGIHACATNPQWVGSTGHWSVIASD